MRGQSCFLKNNVIEINSPSHLSIRMWGLPLLTFALLHVIPMSKLGNDLPHATNAICYMTSLVDVMIWSVNNYEYAPLRFLSGP